ncbi:unnamed protein product, partial [Ectocarpus fasciculatus]
EPVVAIEPAVLPGSNDGDSISLPVQPLSRVNEDAATATATSTHDHFEHVRCVQLAEDEITSLERTKSKDEADVIPGVFRRDDMTPAECAAICEEGGQDGFAVSRGDLCTCFAEEDTGNFDDRKGGVCDSPCTGDASQSCGGVSAFDVYRLIRTGDRNRYQLPPPDATVTGEITTAVGAISSDASAAGTSTADLIGTSSSTSSTSSTTTTTTPAPATTTVTTARTTTTPPPTEAE